MIKKTCSLNVFLFPNTLLSLISYYDITSFFGLNDCRGSSPLLTDLIWKIIEIYGVADSCFILI